MVREMRCWCYCVKRMVTVRGNIIGKRAADLLKVDDCLEVDCLSRGVPDCLVGKVRESRWP